MKNLLILLLVISFPSYVLIQQMQENSGSFIIDATTFIKKSGEVNTVILDVRTTDEFNSGHIENAINIDYTSDQFNTRMASLDKNKTYLLYCHSGNRSKKATKALQEQGFKIVYDLEGGITEWMKNKHPVIR